MGSRLRVVSYNIHSSRDDLVALATVVRSLKPDVLIVQEGPRRWRWRTKCASLAHAFDLVVAGGGLPALGNVVMTNLRIRAVATWCEEYPLTPGRHLRGAVFTRIRAEEGEATIVGAHLSTDDAERPSQAQLLRTAIGRLDGPVVLGADLNDVPGSETWKIVHDDMTEAPTTAPTFPVRGADRRIDTIAVAGGAIITDFLVETGGVTAAASDHFPLVADIILP
jgi:endonuclease/exonuclease/phosphatase family metal-dependent hydrolase